MEYTVNVYISMCSFTFATPDALWLDYTILQQDKLTVDLPDRAIATSCPFT